MKNYIKNIQADLPASIVVFLVALPLCLGIALGSKAPLFSGIIAGIVGGIVVGLISGSTLSVSGPAAGLTAIVATFIMQLSSFESFLLAVLIAGIFQLIFGFLKAGILGDYVPNSVIKGMLAAIGIILILKQIPHLIGYDADYIGDESFTQIDNQNTFTELLEASNYLSIGAVIIGLVSLLILIVFETKLFKSNSILKQIPGPLVVVFTGVLINQAFISNGSELAIKEEHMVNLPIAKDLTGFINFFTFPDLSKWNNLVVWEAAITIAIVASLETLLSIEAVDKLDPYKRVTPTNLELKAQGIGNIISGLIGGLPMTSVIVRSSANVNAGAKTKMSAVYHGLLLLLSAIIIPHVLNLIPLSSLAAILIFTGYKLAKLPLFQEFYKKGLDQFLPFVFTILAILLTDLLIGIVIGILVALLFMVFINFRSSIMLVNDGNNYLVKLRKDVLFINKPLLKSSLEKIPNDSFVLIDSSKADFIDKDIIDVIQEYKKHAGLKNIRVEIKKNDNNFRHDSLN
jgi:MFS superfamily sulfate permease-like transporter